MCRTLVGDRSDRAAGDRVDRRGDRRPRRRATTPDPALASALDALDVGAEPPPRHLGLAKRPAGLHGFKKARRMPILAHGAPFLAVPRSGADRPAAVRARVRGRARRRGAAATASEAFDGGARGSPRRARRRRRRRLRARARPALVGRRARVRDDPGRPAARRGRDRPRGPHLRGAALLDVCVDPDFLQVSRPTVSELAVPLVLPTGVVGVINIETSTPLPAGCDAAVATADAGPRRADGRAARLAHVDLSSLARLFVYMSSLRDPTTIAEVAVRSLGRVLPVETSQLLLLDEEGKLVEIGRMERGRRRRPEPLPHARSQAMRDRIDASAVFELLDASATRRARARRPAASLGGADPAARERRGDRPARRRKPLRAGVRPRAGRARLAARRARSRIARRGDRARPRAPRAPTPTRSRGCSTAAGSRTGSSASCATRRRSGAS